MAYDAIEAAKARGQDVVIVDTAGRLHTQQHLMDELRKVRKVIAAQAPGAPHETLLTIDATTGQNGLRQAMLFRTPSRSRASRSRSSTARPRAASRWRSRRSWECRSS